MKPQETEEEAARMPVTLFDSITAQDEEPAVRQGSPLWVVTFADMITLLLAFFLLVLSFSDLNPDHFRNVSGSLQKSLGRSEKPPPVEPPPAETQLVAGPTEEKLPIPEQLAKDLNFFTDQISR